MREGTMKTTMTAAAAAMLLAAAPAHSVIITVFAKGNSSTGGTGANSITLAAGEKFTVSVDPNDLWSAGALPRYSNADGLVGKLYATGSDESGQAAGVLIGKDYGTWTQNGFTAPFGALVGKIGSSYILLGDSYAGAAPEAGVLKLYYWDCNKSDNFGSIRADVSPAVPEPSTVALMLAGFGLVGWISRKRLAGK